MKTFFKFTIFFLFSYSAFSQNNVGIGTQSPNPNAIIDLSNQGSPLGMLLPRVDIGDFSLGVNDYGLLVYDTLQSKIFFWDGNTWQEPLLSGGGFVTGSGNLNEITFWNGSSTLAGNPNFIWDNANGRLGIGTTTPQTKVQIEGTGSFFVQLRSTETNASAYSELEFGRDNGVGGFFKTGGIGTPGSGDYLQISSPQFIRFITNFSNRMTIGNTGNVTIGTGVSSDLLNINEGNITMFRSDGNDLELTFNADNNGILWTVGVDDGANADFIISQSNNLSNPKIFVSSGIGVGIGTTTPQAELHVFPAAGGNGDIALGTTGSTSYWNMAMTGGNERFILAFNDGSFNDHFVAASTGEIGIGSTNPIEKLHVFDATDPTIRLSSSATTAFSNAINSGTIQFLEANANPGAGAYGGGITYEGASNLLKFQTYNNLTVNDAVLISRATGNVGIKGNPTSELDVYGSMRVSGEVNRTSTGGADLIPICYGMVGTGATINAGSGNFSVTNPSTGRYEITITGESYSFSSFVTNVTCTSGFYGNFDSIGGRLLVNVRNASGTLVNGFFSFVVYKP